MKALIIFSLFLICFFHSEVKSQSDDEGKMVIYGFDNIDIKENGITFNAYTNNKPDKFKLWLNQNDNNFYCICKTPNELDEDELIYNFTCSNKTIKIKTDEQFSIDKEKNEDIEDIVLNTYASAQGKNLKRAEENKFPFEDLEIVYKLDSCENTTGENPMILINCSYSDNNIITNDDDEEQDRNDNATFYIGDGSSKIAIPSKITEYKDNEGKKKIQIELSPHTSFTNVHFHNSIGIDKEQKNAYLLDFPKGNDDRFNFTFISKKNSPKKKGNKLSAGAILAIIIPSVLAIAAVVAIIILLAGKSGAPVATSAPNPQTYNTLGLNSSSSVNKN